MSQVTLAPYGGSFSKISFNSLPLVTQSNVGGHLIDNLKVVYGLSTLPAVEASGIPSAPVTES